MRLDFPPYSLWEKRSGSGTPVALLHGLSASSRWWSRNIEALSARHTVAAVDLVGFGRNVRFSGLPVLLPAFPEVAALVARWLETFNEPVHLVGHSMGGQIAIRLAAERPDLVRSLMLVSAPGMPLRFDPRPHVRAVEKPPYGGAGIARVLVPDFLRAGPASVAVASARVMRGDMRALMHSLRVPTLLVWGENDPLVPLVYGQAMQQEIAGARLEVIPGAAHVPMWDAPAVFNEIALSFFEEVQAKSLPVAEPVFSWGISGWREGITHRQVGRRRDIVLMHGLGMSSAYFEPLAQELFARGWNPIAPDLPRDPAGPEEHALMLAAWADALNIADAVWLGHSIGCNVVAHLSRMRPDIVRSSVLVGPVWTRSRFPSLRTWTMLALDALREPMRLYRHVLPAYWDIGLARWLSTWFRYARDVSCSLPPGLCIAGKTDPIPDRTCVPVTDVPGAHACVFSHPEEVAAQLETRS